MNEEDVEKTPIDFNKQSKKALRMLVIWLIAAVIAAYMFFMQPETASKFIGISPKEVYLYGYGAIGLILFDLFFIFSISRAKRIKEKI
ncbi:MAG: hypothetical protein OEY94_10575 [Alphaproteobacteria bacterium]|nr:hypothetical protein [Alphaproteobacteria bacterium]